MAPRKRKAGGEGEEAVKPIAVTSTRVTRSSTRRSNSNSSLLPPELPKAKKGKAAKKEKAKPEEKEETETETETETEAMTENVEEKDKTTAGGTAKTIIIEHCKQCNSFKTRATQVKTGLEDAVPGINVLLNPEKPRRGCFEIREEGGEKFVSLLDMKRPFKRMKDLNMEEVIADIISKIK